MCNVLLPPGVKTIAVNEYITPYNYRMKQPTSSKNMGFLHMVKRCQRKVTDGKMEEIALDCGFWGERN